MQSFLGRRARRDNAAGTGAKDLSVGLRQANELEPSLRSPEAPTVVDPEGSYAYHR